MSEPTVGGESGFEIARAFVAVDPDASDFAQALDEQVGGISVAVRVTPNAADFQEQLDEQIGTPTAVVSVGADTAPAEGEVESLLSGLDAQQGLLNVGADTSTAREQAAALAEELSSTDASLNVGADTGGAQEGVSGLTGQLDELQGAAGAADGALSGVDAKMAELQAAAEAGQGGVDGLTDSIAGASGALPVLSEEVSGLSDQLNSLGAGFGAGIAGHLGDVSGIGEQIAAGLEGAASHPVTVPVVPDVADFQALLDEETAGTVVTVRIAADAEEADAGLQQTTAELGEVQAAAAGANAEMTTLRELTADSFGSVDYSGVAAGLNSVSDAEQTAADDAASVRSEFGALGAELSATAAQLSEVDERFLQFAAGGGAADDLLLELSERLESLYSQLGAVGGEIGAMSAEFDSGATAIGDVDAQLGAGVSMLREFQAGLAETAGAVDAASAEFFGLQEMAARLNVTLAELPAAWAEMDATLASSAASGAASVAALNGEMGALAASTDAEGAAMANLDWAKLGDFGMLTDMLTPGILLLGTLAAGVAGVVYALDMYRNPADAIIDEMAKQDQATGFNVAGYQKLSDQLSGAAGQSLAMSVATDDVNNRINAAHFGLSEYTADLGAIHEASAQFQTDATNIGGQLTYLEQEYGLTADQVIQLAAAAGVSSKQFKDSSDAAVDAVNKWEAANVGAGNSLSALNNDLGVFDNSALTTQDRITAMDDAYTALAGNFVSEQQAMLSVTAGFDTLAADAATVGASMKGTNQQSVALQQAFYGQASAIEQTANAMVTQGDSTQQVTQYINDQIEKLSTYAGSNEAARQTVQDLHNWESTLTGDLQKQAEYMSTTLDNDLQNAILKYSGVATAVDNYAAALVEYGPKSQRAQTAADALTKSIVAAGTAAGDTTTQIATMVSEQLKIPLKEAIQIVLSAEGQYTISEAAQQSRTITSSGQVNTLGGHTMASGGLVSDGTGPRADDVPAMLSRGEYVVQAPAVDKYGTGLLDGLNAMKYASGGLVSGDYSGTAPGLGSFLDSEYDTTKTDAIQQLEEAMTQAINQAKAAAKAKAAAAGGNATGGSNSANEALGKSMAAAYGWGSGTEWTALNNVVMRESGWSSTVTNSSSGAAGIAQNIAGFGPGYESGNAAEQISWLLAYIKGRYGDPVGAWDHELSAGWYDQGGLLPPGPSMAMNGTGVPERILPPGSDVVSVDKLQAAGGTVNHNNNTFYLTFSGSRPTPEEWQSITMKLTQAVAMA